MGRAGLLEDELCPDMKIKQAARILWQVVNGSFERELTYAEQRLYRRLESGLAKYALAARGERAKGWPHENVMSAVAVLMATPDVLRLLRGVVEQGDKAALSQAEFNLFQVLDQALVLYPDEHRTGKPELHRRCRICGAYLSECHC
jgi:hypothetical protein